MKKNKILIPLPDYGFDPTESAIPWKLLKENEFEVVFATPYGKKANADEIMVSGKKLGILSPILKARADAVLAYHQLFGSKEFENPLPYSQLHVEEFDGLILPGGHEKSMRIYLESSLLQDVVVRFFDELKPVGAICHGVVLAARSIDKKTGKSVLYNYKTTALLESQELLAYQLTRLWLKDYYLTYPEITVEKEVKAALTDETNFLKGNLPLSRDSLTDLKKGFFVKDRNYVSARWPGDAYNFSLAFIKLFEK